MARSTGNKSKRRNFGRIELRASGRYRVGFTAPDGRLYRAPSTFDSKDDAIAWLAARRAEIQLNVWAPDIVERSVAKKAVPTFKSYAQRWLSTRKTRGLPLRPTTRDHYEYVLESTLYPTFGKMPIDEITVEDVNDWYEKGRTGQGVATGTRLQPAPHDPRHGGVDAAQAVDRVQPRAHPRGGEREAGAQGRAREPGGAGGHRHEPPRPIPVDGPLRRLVRHALR